MSVCHRTPAFWGSAWWGKINLEKGGCGGNEQKSVKKGGNGRSWVKIQKCRIPNVEEASNLLSNNNDAPSITKYGPLVWPNAQIVALRAVPTELGATPHIRLMTALVLQSLSCADSIDCVLRYSVFFLILIECKDFIQCIRGISKCVCKLHNPRLDSVVILFQGAWCVEKTWGKCPSPKHVIKARMGQKNFDFICMGLRTGCPKVSVARGGSEDPELALSLQQAQNSTKRVLD